MIEGIGILGVGLWDGPVIENDFFGPDYVARAQVKDPYKGRRSEDGAVRVAGMDLTPDRYPRALAAISHSFHDPYRGTRRRRYFPKDMKVSDAETEAARKALAAAGLEPGDIDAILVQSFLPDQMQPKNAALIAHNLGIHRASAWEVDSICNSFITQTSVGSALIASGQARHVLCVQSVAYSRVIDFSVSSCVAEADMASAFVLGPAPGTQLSFSWRTDGRLHGAIRLQWAPTADAGTRRYWEPTQDRLLIRFEQELQSQVLAELEPNVRTVCDEALARAGMRIDEVDLFVSHQPMSWYGALMEDILGLREGVSFCTFEEYASINSASLTANVCHAQRSGRIQPGTRMLAFGPAAGYLYGAMAMRWGGA